MSNFQLCDSFHKVGFLRAVCGECGGVWGRVVRGVCCWGVECDGGRYSLDGLRSKKCLPLLWWYRHVESRTGIFFVVTLLLHLEVVKLN